MIGLLARVVIGVVVGGIAGAATYGVYKYLSQDNIQEEINDKVKENDVFKEAFKAKVKEKSENGETLTAEVMDQWDAPLGDIVIHADEISDDIKIGDEILLLT